jgi:hypothetical protein
MKEYRLKAWPELPAVFRRIVYRRLLSDLSQRALCEAEMHQRSGLSNADVRALIHFLSAEELLEVTERPEVISRWRLPALLPTWLRRA